MIFFVVEPFKLLPHPRAAGTGPQIMIDTTTSTPAVANKDSLHRRSSMSSPDSSSAQPELARVASRDSHRSASPHSNSSPGSRATPGSRSNSTPSAANTNSLGESVAALGQSAATAMFQLFLFLKLDLNLHKH